MRAPCEPPLWELPAVIAAATLLPLLPPRAVVFFLCRDDGSRERADFAHGCETADVTGWGALAIAVPPHCCDVLVLFVFV